MSYDQNYRELIVETVQNYANEYPADSPLEMHECLIEALDEEIRRFCRERGLTGGTTSE